MRIMLKQQSIHFRKTCIQNNISMYMYVCMYVRLYTSKYVYIHISLNIHVYESMFDNV